MTANSLWSLRIEYSLPVANQECAGGGGGGEMKQLFHFLAPKHGTAHYHGPRKPQLTHQLRNRDPTQAFQSSLPILLEA